MEINLSRARYAMNPAFDPLYEDTSRVHVLIGGASSGKSYDIGLKIILKLVSEPGHKYLVVRKVAKTLRHSCYDQLRAQILALGMGPLFDFRESDLGIKCKLTGNQVIMAGLDDVEKLKSIFGITDIWIEEASEITEADFNQLDLRLRGVTRYPKQITLTMNPVSTMHWVKARFFDRREPDTLTHRSTYLDNLWLDPDTIARLEGITDPYYREVYVLGNWGVFGNLVFRNFVIEDFDIDLADYENVCYGMDYGYVHASVLNCHGFRDGELYTWDEVYGRNWTNADFMAACLQHYGDALYDMDITADSAEPDRIEEWQRQGFRVSPAKKGAGSLRTGIDWLTSTRWHIHATKCPQLAREVPVYQRREDKDGNVIEGKFVELNDDCIAATRYATEYIWGEWHATIGEYSADSIGL